MDHESDEARSVAKVERQVATCSSQRNVGQYDRVVLEPIWVIAIALVVQGGPIEDVS